MSNDELDLMSKWNSFAPLEKFVNHVSHVHIHEMWHYYKKTIHSMNADVRRALRCTQRCIAWLRWNIILITVMVLTWFSGPHLGGKYQYFCTRKYKQIIAMIGIVLLPPIVCYASSMNTVLCASVLKVLEVADSALCETMTTIQYN